MKISGFTLTELLVTIAIMAVVSLIGVPSFNSMIRSSSMRSNGSDLLTAFNYARTEAVKRGTSVELEQSDGATWTGGIVVWVDSDDDDTLDSDEKLRVWDEFSTSSSIVSSNSLTSFVFDASGEVNNKDVLTLCDDRTGETGRTISILASGAIYAEEADCE